MEFVSVKKKPCLLRLRTNCPFRRIRRHANAISSAIGFYWNNVEPPTSNQPICSPSIMVLSSGYNQSDEASDIHMEDNRLDTENERKQQKKKNPETRTENYMEFDHTVDPETGERAQG